MDSKFKALLGLLTAISEGRDISSHAEAALIKAGFAHRPDGPEGVITLTTAGWMMFYSLSAALQTLEAVDDLINSDDLLGVLDLAAEVPPEPIKGSGMKPGG